ncbi:Peptidase S8/S53 domain containing protein [Rhypophila sp. PSN 637]
MSFWIVNLGNVVLLVVGVSWLNLAVLRAAIARFNTSSIYGDSSLTRNEIQTQSDPYLPQPVRWNLGRHQRECYWANEISSSTVESPPDQCFMSCTGNPLDICGDGNRINIYEDTTWEPSEPEPTPVVVPSVGSFKNQGCFFDYTSGHRVLQADSTTDNSESGMTVENTPCAGNALELCGSGNRIEVYEDEGWQDPTKDEALEALQLCHSFITQARDLVVEYKSIMELLQNEHGSNNKAKCGPSDWMRLTDMAPEMIRLEPIYPTETAESSIKSLVVRRTGLDIDEIGGPRALHDVRGAVFEDDAAIAANPAQPLLRYNRNLSLAENMLALMGIPTILGGVIGKATGPFISLAVVFFAISGMIPPPDPTPTDEPTSSSSSSATPTTIVLLMAKDSTRQNFEDIVDELVKKGLTIPEQNRDRVPAKSATPRYRDDPDEPDAQPDLIPYHLQWLSAPWAMYGLPSSESVQTYWALNDSIYDPSPSIVNNVHVYVLDTGARLTHRDIIGNIGVSYDAKVRDLGATADGDIDGHGTCMASCVGGSSSGVFKQADIVPIKILDIALVEHDVKTAPGFLGVMSMSFGFDFAKLRVKDGQVNFDPFQDLLSRMRGLNVVPVARSGNGGTDKGGDDLSDHTPRKWGGSSSDVIVVGNTNVESARYYQSTFLDRENRGILTVYAMGQLVPCADSKGDNQYKPDTGSSPATATMAGLVALKLATGQWTVANAKQNLVNDAITFKGAASTYPDTVIDPADDAVVHGNKGLRAALGDNLIRCELDLENPQPILTARRPQYTLPGKFSHVVHEILAPELVDLLDERKQHCQYPGRL